MPMSYDNLLRLKKLSELGDEHAYDEALREVFRRGGDYLPKGLASELTKAISAARLQMRERVEMPDRLLARLERKRPRTGRIELPPRYSASRWRQWLGPELWEHYRVEVNEANRHEIAYDFHVSNVEVVWTLVMLDLVLLHERGRVRFSIGSADCKREGCRSSTTPKLNLRHERIEHIERLMVLGTLTAENRELLQRLAFAAFMSDLDENIAGSWGVYAIEEVNRTFGWTFTVSPEELAQAVEESERRKSDGGPAEP